MEENKAQTTSEVNTSSVGVTADTETSATAAVSAENADSTNAESFTDGEAEQPSEKVEKTKQSADENREYARRRREAEREKLVADTRTKAFIEALGGKNPFNGEDLKDADDVEEYLLMKKIEAEGGDPLSDFSKYRKRKDREARDAAQRAEEKKAWFAKDREAFETKHPNVNLDDLIADEGFAKYAEGKVGVMPLADIYQGFNDLVGRYDDKAKAIAAQAVANRQASPGSVSTSGEAQSDFFTPEQVRKMSREDIRKNYEKIRASMAKW